MDASGENRRVTSAVFAFPVGTTVARSRPAKSILERLSSLWKYAPKGQFSRIRLACSSGPRGRSRLRDLSQAVCHQPYSRSIFTSKRACASTPALEHTPLKDHLIIRTAGNPKHVSQVSALRSDEAKTANGSQALMYHGRDRGLSYHRDCAVRQAMCVPFASPDRDQ
jgi:hypothetical protein